MYGLKSCMWVCPSAGALQLMDVEWQLQDLGPAMLYLKDMWKAKRGEKF